MQKARWLIHSDMQAFSGNDKTHGVWASWAKISMELFAFVSQDSDALAQSILGLIMDTSFNSTERPTTPTVEPSLSESKPKRIRQGTNGTMKINSEPIIRHEEGLGQ